jgi:chromate transporter
MSTLLLLFWTFFKISFFSIGGGYNMIPLMQHEIEAYGWLPPGRFMDVLAVSEITPGPMAVNLATFAGYQVAGVPGSVVATVGVCLPGAILLLALGTIAIRLRDRPAFRAAMRGLMPALVGLLSATAIRLGMALVPPGATFPTVPTIAIFAAALGLILWPKVHPLPLLAAAAGVGILFRLIAA